MRSSAVLFVVGVLASAAGVFATDTDAHLAARAPATFPSHGDSRPTRQRRPAGHVSAAAVPDSASTPAAAGTGRRQRRALRDAIARQHEHRSIDITALIGRLQNVRNIMALHQNNIHRSRNQLKSSPRSGKSTHYRSSVHNELVAYRRAAGGSTPVISQLGAAFAHFGRGTGTENLDRNNQVEVLLKDVVNSIKYTLSDINYIIFKLPILGPILGPIVYDIKCLVDELLNGIENSVDSLLNCVAPQLTHLTAELGISLAHFGLPIGGGSSPLAALTS